MKVGQLFRLCKVCRLTRRKRTEGTCQGQSTCKRDPKFVHFRDRVGNSHVRRSWSLGLDVPVLTSVRSKTLTRRLPTENSRIMP